MRMKFLDRFRGKPKVEAKPPEPVKVDKPLVETVQKKVEVVKPIEQRLSFRKGFLDFPASAQIKESGLFLDERQVFEPPLGGIDTGGVLKSKDSDKHVHYDVYLGTGDCCNGHVYFGAVHKDGFSLYDIVAVDTNVQDLIPLVFRDGAKPPDGVSRAPLDSCVLVVGAGCAGAGVRIVNLKGVRITDVIPTQEYYDTHYAELVRRGLQHEPRFRVDVQNGRIYVDLLKNKVQVRAGMTRDPNFPTALWHPADEYVVLPDVALTVDLTQRLAGLGVDIAKTIEMLRSYHRILEKTSGGD